jgi:nucleoside-diphosphate-sugar epimerase
MSGRPARSKSSAERPSLVVGASGFLGLSIVRALATGGREVRGLVRSESKGELVRRHGGVPLRGDILEPASLRRASQECGSIVHVAAGGGDGGSSPDLLRRVRVEGTQNLIAAARENHVPRLVVGSGYWVYAGQPATISESSPVDPRGESRINFEAERAGLESSSAGGPDVMVVRPGMVYGDGAWFRPMVDAIRAGTYRYVGDGANLWSFVSLPDTGDGFRRVVESGRSGEVYNLVDGRPAPWKEFVEFVARRLGAPSPTGISREAGIDLYGPDVTHHLQANRATSSSKLESLGWRPRFPEYQVGVGAVLDEMVSPSQTHGR